MYNTLLPAKPGHTYLLTVHIGNETFSSSSTMPQRVNLGNLYVSTAPLSVNDGATGANESASPANPVSNISGGALGYFSAQTVQQKSTKVN